MTRRVRTIVAALALCTLAANLAGCAAQQTPAQTALDAHATYDMVMSGLTEARRAGKISDAEKAQIEQIRVPTYAAILAMDDSALANNTPGFNAALDQFRAGLKSLRDWYLRVKPPAKPLP